MLSGWPTPVTELHIDRPSCPNLPQYRGSVVFCFCFFFKISFILERGEGRERERERNLSVLETR